MRKTMQIKILQDRVKELEDALDLGIAQIERYQTETQNLNKQKKEKESSFLKLGTENYLLKKELSNKNLKKSIEENKVLKKEIADLKKQDKLQYPKEIFEIPQLSKTNLVDTQHLEKEIDILKKEIDILKDEIIRTRRVSKKLDSYIPEEIKPPNRGLNGVRVKGL